jgi:Tol biopolymer transport system component
VAILSVEPDGSGLTTLTTMSEHELAAEPAWSPDGGRIALSCSGSRRMGNGSLGHLVMDADGRNGHPITDGPGSSWAPSWSPDGTRIAFMRSSEG